MDTIQYIFRFLYRIRLWLIFLPLLVTLYMIYKTRNMTKTYEVSATIYSGIATGYNIETDGAARIDWSLMNNTMDNLINIIRSKATLKEVSYRLYAENMIYGDSLHDNNYLLSNTYKALVAITPKEVQVLIDKKSVDKTIENLKKYEKPDSKNFVYGLFNWFHPHYSYYALSKIEVKRAENSDILEIKYISDDPGIAYNTLQILNKEFVNQYQFLRFSETNDVIKYFENELAIQGAKLDISEDSLTQYYVENRIINYYDQTKEIAGLSANYQMDLKDISRNYNSAKSLIEELESRMDKNTLLLKDNSVFLSKLKKISDLTTAKVELEAFNTDSTSAKASKIQRYRRELAKAESDLYEFSDKYNTEKYSKEGISSSQFISPWMEQLLRKTKAEAELQVMNEFTTELNKEYAHFAPIGSTIKRKEREIDFTERNYLSILSSLNAARLRQKNLQMSSASLKVLNEPIFPINPLPTKRRMMVAGAFAGTFAFVLGFFILLEIIDRTLRDKIRTERITGIKVLGAFPGPSALKHRGFNKECERIASKSLFNSIQPYLANRTKFINFISMEEGDGKTYLVEQLKEYLYSLGISVYIKEWDMNNNIQKKDYLLTVSSELADLSGKLEILIVKHPPLQEMTIPNVYLENAALNILIARADKGWTDTHQELLKRTKQQASITPLFIYLNRANRHTVETFTGMLPPFTSFRKFLFKLYQLGLTSR